MDTLIQQLRDLGYSFNPPCSEAQIRALEFAIDYSLDATIAALYRDHNGMQPLLGFTLPLRLICKRQDFI